MFLDLRKFILVYAYKKQLICAENAMYSILCTVELISKYIYNY